MKFPRILSNALTSGCPPKRNSKTGANIISTTINNNIEIIQTRYIDMIPYHLFISVKYDYSLHCDMSVF